ncbi:MAG: hypothetical protein HWN65_15610 [Candidatus Helarchaeota archaeon]|nr:hypothetical protein [Candidatus Helarchaeota archaeon]
MIPQVIKCLKKLNYISEDQELMFPKPDLNSQNDENKGSFQRLNSNGSGDQKQENKVYNDLFGKNFAYIYIFFFFMVFYLAYLYVIGDLTLFDRLLPNLFNLIIGVIILVIASVIIRAIYYYPKKRHVTESKISLPILPHTFFTIIFLSLFYYYPITILEWVLVLVTFTIILFIPTPKQAVIPYNINQACLITMDIESSNQTQMIEIYSILTAGNFMLGAFFILLLLHLYPIPAFLILFLKKPLLEYYKRKNYKVGIVEKFYDDGYEVGFVTYKYHEFENEYERDKIYRYSYTSFIIPLFFPFVSMFLAAILSASST